MVVTAVPTVGTAGGATLGTHEGAIRFTWRALAHYHHVFRRHERARRQLQAGRQSI